MDNIIGNLIGAGLFLIVIFLSLYFGKKLGKKNPNLNPERSSIYPYNYIINYWTNWRSNWPIIIFTVPIVVAVLSIYLIGKYSFLVIGLSVLGLSAVIFYGALKKRKYITENPTYKIGEDINYEPMKTIAGADFYYVWSAFLLVIGLLSLLIFIHSN